MKIIDLNWLIGLDVGYLASKGKTTTGTKDIIFYKRPLINLKVYVDNVLWNTQPYWDNGDGMYQGELYYGSTYRVDFDVEEGYEMRSYPGIITINGNIQYYNFFMNALDGYPGLFELYTVS